jgi:uncharacterized protein YecE (DUF72 family)
MTEYRIGTQGWSYKDWVGTFYPEGTQAGQYLETYAAHFDTVELDTTFYRTPSLSMVHGWDQKTPDGFIFASKLPREITHDRALFDVDAVLTGHVAVMECLGPKLGPMLAQLPPQFHRGPDEWATLKRFVTLLPPEFQFAIEFRHRSWLQEDTYDLLRENGVAWCSVDLFYMPKVHEVTAPFTYVRWLGERSKIEQVDRVQIDRRRELIDWSRILKERVSPKVTRVYAYVNNHYSGHSPANVRQLEILLKGTSVGEPRQVSGGREESQG